MRRKINRVCRTRKSTAYYVMLLCGIALTFGLGTSAISGVGILGDHENRALTLHESKLFVGEDHKHTPLGDVAFGKQAQAHTYPYCGHSTRWITIDSTVHKLVYLRHVNNGDHRNKMAHYRWSGTGYVRASDWRYYTTDCNH